jgi:hypothetical protein
MATTCAIKKRMASFEGTEKSYSLGRARVRRGANPMLCIADAIAVVLAQQFDPAHIAKSQHVLKIITFAAQHSTGERACLGALPFELFA